MKTLIRGLAAMLLVLLAACSSAPIQQRMNERLALYTAAAGAPVRSFRFLELYSWEALGDSNLAVYTRPNEAWLLDLDGPCPNLTFANAIAITSFANEVSARFDKVIAGRSIPCIIGQIRPIDVSKLKKALKEQHEIRSAPRPEQVGAPPPAAAGSGN